MSDPIKIDADSVSLGEALSWAISRCIEERRTFPASFRVSVSSFSVLEQQARNGMTVSWSNRGLPLPSRKTVPTLVMQFGDNTAIPIEFDIDAPRATGRAIGIEGETLATIRFAC